MDRRSFCAALPALALAPQLLRAAPSYPTRPVRVILPYAAGGGPDVQMRQASPTLGEVLGQSIVVENKVGAAGVLAAQYVAQQPADGYTLLLGTSSHLIQKILQPSVAFDPLADFAFVGNMVASPTVLVVRADSPFKTLEDLIAAVRAAPGQMNYGSGGIGTAAHLAGATLASLAGLKVMHIPLKGSVEIAASLMRNDTQFAFPISGTAIPQVKGGTLRALAVTSSERLPQLPGVPTLKERLNSDLAVQESWSGIWAPAKTPADIVDVLFTAVTKTARTPSVQTAFQGGGSASMTSESPKAFGDFIRGENRKWMEVIKLAGVSTNN